MFCHLFLCRLHMYLKQSPSRAPTTMFKIYNNPPVRVFHVQSIGETVTFAPENVAYAWKKKTPQETRNQVKRQKQSVIDVTVELLI